MRSEQYGDINDVCIIIIEAIAISRDIPLCQLEKKFCNGFYSEIYAIIFYMYYKQWVQ